jgi:hypothetical protein
VICQDAVPGRSSLGDGRSVTGTSVGARLSDFAAVFQLTLNAAVAASNVSPRSCSYFNFVLTSNAGPYTAIAALVWRGLRRYWS